MRVIGKNHDPLSACATIIAAVFTSIVLMLVLKGLYDFVRPRNESLIQRYIEIVGRITALVVGTVAVDMIMQGIRTWTCKF